MSMPNEIKTVYQLHKRSGETVWLVTTVLANHDGQTVISDTFCTPWVVGEIMDWMGQHYSGHKKIRVNYPWFCFEKNRIRVKNGVDTRPVFVVGDYVGRNKIFTSEAAAKQYQMTIKLQEPATNYRRPEVSGFIFEGMTISMNEFLKGYLPGFGKETWERK